MTTINPATDFFLYANGSWIKKNPIPADQSHWSVGSLIHLDFYNRLRVINEKAVSENAAPGSITQKIAASGSAEWIQLLIIYPDIWTHNE